jgi:hypothetical protein
MTSQPRVALFCETFHEVNGVALTARQRWTLPNAARVLSCGPRGPRVAQFTEGSVTHLGAEMLGQLRHRARLRYDLFCGISRRGSPRFDAIQPDLIHVTSPREFGQIGAYLAHATNSLVASWHESSPVCRQAITETADISPAGLEGVAS